MGKSGSVRGGSQSKGGKKDEQTRKPWGCTHTHTHNTFMEKESKNRKPMQWWNPSTRQRELLFIQHGL